jgi:tetratricopeptide (TPR) repeat protein
LALLFLSLPLAAQQSQPQAGDGKGKAEAPASSPAPIKAAPPDVPKNPNLTAPRSDDGEQAPVIGDIGESSSSGTKIDLSAPPNDDKAHPESADAVAEAEAAASGGATVAEFHPWDPHKAAKDVEVGDYYFKRKNYRGAESRYREALFYKENDAIATLRLAECLEQLGDKDEAADQFKAYLKIMPHGPQSEEARLGLDRVRKPQPKLSSAPQ